MLFPVWDVAATASILKLEPFDYHVVVLDRYKAVQKLNNIALGVNERGISHLFHRLGILEYRTFDARREL